jgi:hypothetical protein
MKETGNLQECGVTTGEYHYLHKEFCYISVRNWKFTSKHGGHTVHTKSYLPVRNRKFTSKVWSIITQGIL